MTVRVFSTYFEASGVPKPWMSLWNFTILSEYSFDAITRTACARASTMIALALYITLGEQANAPVIDVILASFAGQLLSDVTPARSGYFLTPFILNKMVGTTIESSMAGVVATGAVNFFVKAILSLIALTYYVRVLPFDLEILSALSVGIAVLSVGGIGLLFLARERRILQLTQKLERIPFFGNFIAKIIVFKNFQEEVSKVKKKAIWIIILVLLSVFMNATALHFISKSLGLNTPSFLDFLLIVPLVSALMYVPLTVAGLGIQEMGYVSLLGLLGVQIEEAVTFALLVRLLFTGTDMIGIYPLLKVGFTNLNLERRARALGS